MNPYQKKARKEAYRERSTREKKAIDLKKEGQMTTVATKLESEMKRNRCLRVLSLFPFDKKPSKASLPLPKLPAPLSKP